MDAIQVLVHRGSADPELPRDVGGPETVGPHPADLGDPGGIQGLAAFVPACGLGPSDTFDLPLALEVVFELREHPEHGVEHLPHRGCGIDVLLGDVEADVALPQLVGDLDQVGERAPEAVDPSDGEHDVVENWDSANGFIFGRGGEVATNRVEEQELSVLSLHLLQACLVYVNTLMLQRVLVSRTGARG